MLPQVDFLKEQLQKNKNKNVIFLDGSVNFSIHFLDRVNKQAVGSFNSKA